MNQKPNFAKKISKFLAGRGFYIVLFACVAVIGVSAWSLVLTGRNEGEGYYVDYSDTVAVTPTPDLEAFAPRDPTQVVRPNPTPVTPNIPTPTPTPVPTPTPPPATPTPEPEHNEKPKRTIADLTFVRPVAGEISQEYSVDALVYSRTLGDWRTHAGVDFSAALGTKVQAACDGTVSAIVEDNLLGTTVIIDHGFGLQSFYSNLAAQPVVAVGDNVAAGSVIGAVGETAIGEIGEVSHLHFAMALNGERVDPMGYLP